MLDGLVSLLAPHPCSGCGKIGTILCPRCEYDIVSQPYLDCLVCGRNDSSDGMCRRCRPAYQKAWCVGERVAHLETLIDRVKFARAQAGIRTLAHLLDVRLPPLDPQVVLVPIPTTPRHIRRRGYDHVASMTTLLASTRRLHVDRCLERATSTVQRGAGRDVRLQQAAHAFSVRHKLEPQTTYLLVDDVMTTGATMQAAAHILQQNGATVVYCCVLARQTLD